LNAGSNEPSSLSTAEATDLPHEIFDGYWEALIYEETIWELLLRVFTEAIQEYSDQGSDLAQSSRYNTALSHGPRDYSRTCSD
jgi:hypothetical protein